MASTVAVLLLLSGGLFTVGFADDNDCIAYITSNHEYRTSESCGNGLFSSHCCGTCDYRYCCPLGSLKLSAYEQHVCAIQNSDVLIIVLGVIGTVITCIVFISCCCCPCCCMYHMCRKPRPVVGATHITTVMNTQSVQQQQQPVMQPVQYPAYQPVPTQPGYGAPPMQTGPYQGQPYAPGPPPSYNMAANSGYPSSQAPYDGSQATYLDQPPYNPAYMQPPKTGY